MINNHSVSSGISDWPALSPFWLHLFLCLPFWLYQLSHPALVFFSQSFVVTVSMLISICPPISIFMPLCVPPSSLPTSLIPGMNCLSVQSCWRGGGLQMSQFVNDIFYGSCSGSIILRCFVDSASDGMVTFRVLLAWFLQPCLSGLSHSSVSHTVTVDFRRNRSIMRTTFKKYKIQTQF